MAAAFGAAGGGGGGASRGVSLLEKRSNIAPRPGLGARRPRRPFHTAAAAADGGGGGTASRSVSIRLEKAAALREELDGLHTRSRQGLSDVAITRHVIGCRGDHVASQTFLVTPRDVI
jgi:hypothetical protein